MIPLDKVKDIILRHNNLEKELSSGNLDSKLFAKKSKEYSNLENIISIAKSYINFEDEKKDLEQILQDKNNDSEMIEMAKKDLDEMILKKNNYENELKIFLLPKDLDDEKNAIVEIRAGTGGLEASLFCADLFKMYEKVCSKKKWQLEIISISKSDAGGFKEVIFSVNGNDIYSYLKYESGVHRVQRIPETEKITSLNPPASLFDILIISNTHFFLEQTFSYILNKSEQKRDASKPPVPALISTIAFLSSSSSFGNKKTFNLFS